MKRRVPKPLLIVLLVVVLAYPAFQLFILGYTGLRMLVAGQESHEVVYKITGTADRPDISYSPDGHQVYADVKYAELPWESGKLTIKGSSQFLSVRSLKQLDDEGLVKCEIWVDGKLVVSQDSTTGVGLSADCTHRP